MPGLGGSPAPSSSAAAGASRLGGRAEPKAELPQGRGSAQRSPGSDDFDDPLLPDDSAAAVRTAAAAAELGFDDAPGLPDESAPAA
eukprot:289831-Chlamydomonas_euryale.AAC.1